MDFLAFYTSKAKTIVLRSYHSTNFPFPLSKGMNIFFDSLLRC